LCSIFALRTAVKEIRKKDSQVSLYSNSANQASDVLELINAYFLAGNGKYQPCAPV
jgi:hypothetical protein